MIKLINGSIFGDKCDLLIIPANNLGGVTNSVYEELNGNGLPYLHKKIDVGDVQFVQVTNKFANALTIGYAASVDVFSDSSSESILKSISEKIKNYCYNQSLQKVNIPLLGTGTGKLSARSSYTVLKKAFENDPWIMLCVYALSPDTFHELVSENISSTNSGIKNPRVFISYTGTDNNK